MQKHSPVPAAAQKKKLGFHIDFGDYGILYALILFWVLLAITNKDFRGLAFYQNILTRASLNAICGIGMTFVIAEGELDLSVASQVALNGVVLTMLVPLIGVVPAMLAVIALGILMGCFNGILIARLRIPAFIATLAMQFGYRALAQLVSSSPIVVENRFLKKLASYKIFGVLPTAFLILILLAVIGTVILRRTKVGRNILAIGNSPSAAVTCGINVPKTKIWIYILVGLFTSLSSIMIVSSLGSSNYGMQTGLEFTVISAVVLGGTALSGGKGSIFNTVVAAIFLVTIRSAMDSFQVNSYWQKVVEGVILILAFSITEIRALIGKGLVRYKARRSAEKQAKTAA